MPAKKRLCQTCGYKIPAADTGAEDLSTSRTVKKATFWSRLMGSAEPKTAESSGQEKPALG
ncbi:MAG: hypothetical protein AB7W16_25970 [Candidatus Obscuribacterales bacterium]